MTDLILIQGGLAVPQPAPSPSPLYEPAAVLSPSQVNCFLDCPAKWCFRYLIERPETKSGALAVGDAVHATIHSALATKLVERHEPEPEDVREAYAVAWAEALSDAEFRDDEDAEDLARLGELLVEKYLAEAVPQIEPARLEHPVEGEIAGVKVRGRIDILDVHGQIIDVKTAGKKPGSVPADHLLQLVTYDLLCPESRGRARLDTLVKAKTIQYVPQSIEIGPDDVEYAETLYPLVQLAMRDGVFYPRRDHCICSRKHCSFWRDCEKEYGGKVKE
jgi:hypothetical protein